MRAQCQTTECVSLSCVSLLAAPGLAAPAAPLMDQIINYEKEKRKKVCFHSSAHFTDCVFFFFFFAEEKQGQEGTKREEGKET